MIGRLYYFVPPEISEPDWRGTYLAVILRRANALLTKRNAREIQFMLDSIGYLLSRGVPKMLKAKSAERAVNLNPAAILRVQMAEVELDGQAKLRNASWPEYFAALAVGLCERAFVYERPFIEPQPHVEALDPPELWLDSELIGHAAEAVLTAEVASADQARVARAEAKKKRRRIAAEEAARARWQEVTELKDRFYSELRKGSFGKHSVTESARRYFRKLTRSEQKLIVQDGDITKAVRNLTSYARQRRREDAARRSLTR